MTKACALALGYLINLKEAVEHAPAAVLPASHKTHRAVSPHYVSYGGTTLVENHQGKVKQQNCGSQPGCCQVQKSYRRSAPNVKSLRTTSPTFS